MHVAPPGSGHTRFHPRWYRSRVSIYWWMERWAYVRFILRELTSVFVAWTVVLLLLHLKALTQGAEAYAVLQAWLTRPGMVIWNAISLAFVLYHTITWFNLAPHAMAVRFRGKRVPALMISAPNYLAWLAVSAGFVWLVVRG